MAAHDLADSGEIGRAAGGFREHRGNLVEVRGTEHAGRHDGEEPRVGVVAVLERVHGAARNEDGLARAQFALLAVDRERRDAGQAVVGLIETVVAVC